MKRKPFWFLAVALLVPTLVLLSVVALILPFAKPVAIVILWIVLLGNALMSLWAPKVLRWVDSW